MEIFIDVPGGNKITLQVKSSDRVKNVKMKIQQKEGIPPELQCLVSALSRTKLEDHHVLRDYSIRGGSTLILAPKLPNKQVPMKIIIRIVTGETTGTRVTLEVKPSDFIADVKKRIQEQGVLPEPQCLMFAGKELDDKHTLRKYNIRNGSFLLSKPKFCYYSFLQKSTVHSRLLKKIFVKVGTEKKITLEVKSTDTINDVKQRIQITEGSFMFNGEQLEDSLTLSQPYT